MMAPSAFLATVFVEPIIFQFPGQTQIIADQALKRRDRWLNYEEARAAFSKSKGMSDWHPEQLQKYIVSRVGRNSPTHMLISQFRAGHGNPRSQVRGSNILDTENDEGAGGGIL